MKIINQITNIAKNKGIIKASDLEAEGISRNYLYKLHKAGKLQKMSRGLYALPDASFTENVNLVEVAKRVPNAVVCLIALTVPDTLTRSAYSVINFSAIC